ncbi:TrkH family potassium uptake protein [Dialister hominis]|uniref:TrkH family potassium uptake protein n=2 Tax=Dialister hominis TaxID=2582419 RepID=UPI003AF62862
MFRYIVSALSQLHRGVLICGGFALFMVFGALLLMLPFSTTGNAEVSFVDALFMSVSVVSVTGMSMFDVRTDFTIFGQLVILFLMQVGGLGIMTIMAMVGISTGRKIRLQERLLIRDSFNLQTPSGMVMLVRKIIFMTLLVEFISGTLLAVYFYFKFGPMGIYLGYWHAVSAFTNCGLDIMGANAGFAKMAADPFVSTVIVVTMFLGGVGFMAADDFLRHRSWSGLSLNSKLIFLMEAILIPLGTIIFYNLEGNNPETLGGLSTMEKWQSAVFMSVSSRLGGFAVFDIHSMLDQTVLLVMMFMFIGAAPVSTGGGIRTTTIGLLFLSLYAWIRGKKDVVIFHKHVDPDCLVKASNVFTLAVVITFITAFLVFVFEPMSFDFEDVMFEAVSAFSTVGFSMGLTGEWNTPCKIVLMIAMYIGRIGVMTLAITFASHHSRQLKYPKENIIVG